MANLGLLPTGVLKLKVTLINVEPIEFRLSIEGTTFNGNTIFLRGKSSETILIANLNSTGTLILPYNFLTL